MGKEVAQAVFSRDLQAGEGMFVLLWLLPARFPAGGSSRAARDVAPSLPSLLRGFSARSGRCCSQRGVEKLLLRAPVVVGRAVSGWVAQLLSSLRV